MTVELSLQALGWTPFFQAAFDARAKAGEIPGRVIEEQRGAYAVQTADGEWLAGISGRMRHHATRREDFPAVGDWVSIKTNPREKTATLQATLPRKNKLSRKTSGQEADEQLIAANIDTVFIVTSLNKDFNVRRLERYLALVAESAATPVVLLSKADLSDPTDATRELQTMGAHISAVAFSAVTGFGLSHLDPYLQKEKTVVMIGSSGVGKSTLVNRLCGRERQKVQAVREADDRGLHTTTARRMITLPQGCHLIDTPGMRELQVWDAQGVNDSFADILELINACRFRDCRHTTDAGCAVQSTIKDGRLTAARFDNYLKLTEEANRLKEHLDRAADQKANEKIQRVRAEHKRQRKQADD